MIENMLTKEEWRKEHPRMHGKKYNTYVKKWLAAGSGKGAEQEGDEPSITSGRSESSALPDESGVELGADSSIPDINKPIEVEPVGIIDNISKVVMGAEAGPVGNVDRALMDAQARRANLRSIASKLAERMRGVDDGVVGADVFMETTVLCGDLLLENAALLKLAGRIYERGKAGIVAQDESGKKFKHISKAGSEVLGNALKEE